MCACVIISVSVCSGFSFYPNVYPGVYADEPEESVSVDMLYAKSAVLMDADSGRVLFEKNGQEVRAMASTTKIMTCIVTLENGNLEDKVKASKKAAAQPKVHLGMQEGEEFYLKDLLSSLMLESHNDSAVAIAEHVGGSVEGFADLMNQKAEELGLSHTYFITPNGLDACDEKGIHATTAEELALILRYCIKESPKKDAFLEITRQPNVQFGNVEGSRNFSCYNHNAFLSMMDGALTGKTGFTGDAGYCYIGALRQDDRTFIVALLGCGWPNNKSYKWSDTKKLMKYGLANYQYKNVYEEIKLPALPVNGGVKKMEIIGEQVAEVPIVDIGKETPKLNVLLNKDEKVSVTTSLPKNLIAPVKKGDVIGQVTYSLNGMKIREYPIKVSQSIKKITWKWCLQQVWERILMH